VCLQSPQISHELPYPTRGVRGPVPLLLGRGFTVALGATSGEVSGTFTFITNRKCGATITVPMGPTTVCTLGGALRCWLGACGSCCRRRLLLWWIPLSVPGALSTSSVSSWWSSATLSSAVTLTRVVSVLPCLVRSHAGRCSCHGACSVVGGLHRMSAILLLHTGEHGSYQGHVRDH